MKLHQRFLSSLAGADLEVLDQCTHSESVKFTSLGIQLILNFVFILLGISYAVFLISGNLIISTLIGIIGAGVVFLVNRLFINSIKKNAFHKSGRLAFLTSFSLRILFATLISIIISQSLLIKIFKPSIDEYIYVKIQENRSAIYEKTDSLLQEEYAELGKIEEELDCMRSLLSAEATGRKIELDCGYSSGLLGAGPRLKQIETEINRLEYESNRQAKTIDEIKTTTLQRAENITNSGVNSYLNNSAALNHLISSDDNSINLLRWFLFILILIIDLLPSITRLLVSSPQYDELFYHYEQMRTRLGVEKLEYTGNVSFKMFKKDIVNRLRNNNEALIESEKKSLTRIEYIRELIDSNNFKDGINDLFQVLEEYNLDSEQKELLVIASQIKFLQNQVKNDLIDEGLAKREYQRLKESLDYLVSKIEDLDSSSGNEKLSSISNT